MQRHLRGAEHGDDVLEVRLKIVADRKRDVAERRQDLRLDVAVHCIALHGVVLRVSFVHRAAVAQPDLGSKVCAHCLYD